MMENEEETQSYDYNIKDYILNVALGDHMHKLVISSNAYLGMRNTREFKRVDTSSKSD